MSIELHSIDTLALANSWDENLIPMSIFWEVHNCPKNDKIILGAWERMWIYQWSSKKRVAKKMVVLM